MAMQQWKAGHQPSGKLMLIMSSLKDCDRPPPYSLDAEQTVLIPQSADNLSTLSQADWAPRTVHPRTVPNCTEHLRAESPPCLEFLSASRTELIGECTVRYDSLIMYGRQGVHLRTVPNRTEHFRAESPPRSEFSSASRTELIG